MQPDVEQLTQNMEDNEDAESKKSAEVLNLGRLQFSLDYDFQKQEVAFMFYNQVFSILLFFV